MSSNLSSKLVLDEVEDLCAFNREAATTFCELSAQNKLF